MKVVSCKQKATVFNLSSLSILAKIYLKPSKYCKFTKQKYEENS